MIALDAAMISKSRTMNTKKTGKKQKIISETYVANCGKLTSSNTRGAVFKEMVASFILMNGAGIHIWILFSELVFLLLISLHGDRQQNQNLVIMFPFWLAKIKMV